MRPSRSRLVVLPLAVLLLLGGTAVVARPALLGRGASSDARRAQAGPALRSATTAATRGLAGSLRIRMPAGVAANDLLVAGVTVRALNPSRIEPPAGWKRVRADVAHARPRLTQAVFVKVAAASEPSTQRWSLGRPAVAAAVVLAYRGISAEDPVESHSGRAIPGRRRAAVRARTGVARQVEAPSLKTSTPGDLVVGFFASGGRMKTAPPGGSRERADRASPRSSRRGAVTLAAVDFVQRQAGPTGRKVAIIRPRNVRCGRTAVSCRPPGRLIGQLIALRPAPAALPPGPGATGGGGEAGGGGGPGGTGGGGAAPGGAQVSPLAPSTGPAFYVAPTGSDANPGTAAQPWRTIQKALDTLRPSERGVVRAGTYVEDLEMTRAGTAAAPITVEAHPGERAVLRSAGSHPLEVATSAAYFRLRGFVIEDHPGTSGGNVDVYGHHVEISGNEVRDSTDQGIYTDEGSHHVWILGNWIHHNGEGIVHQGHGIYLQGDDHLVLNNVIHDHPHGFGIQVYDKGRRAAILHNTVVASAHSGIVVGGEGGVDGVRIHNNILAFNSKWGVQRDSVCPTSAIADHNVLFGNGNGAIEGGCPGIDTSGGNFEADPRFVDVAARNLHLLPGSSALDRAAPEWSAGTDWDGQARPQGAGADIGAFEDG